MCKVFCGGWERGFEKVPTVVKLAKTMFKIDFERYFTNLLVFLRYCSFEYWSGIGIIEYVF